jgi:hypothetical protein
VFYGNHKQSKKHFVESQNRMGSNIGEKRHTLKSIGLLPDPPGTYPGHCGIHWIRTLQIQPDGSSLEFYRIGHPARGNIARLHIGRSLPIGLDHR